MTTGDHIHSIGRLVLDSLTVDRKLQVHIELKGKGAIAESKAPNDWMNLFKCVYKYIGSNIPPYSSPSVGAKPRPV